MTENNKSFTSLKDIITNILSDTNLPFNPDDARLWEIWDDAVGTPISAHAKPYWIRKKRLRVNVSDSIWLQELEYAKETIMEKVNFHLGREAVKEIEFRIGKV